MARLTTPTDTSPAVARRATLLQRRRLAEETVADVALLVEGSPDDPALVAQLDQARRELLAADTAISTFDLARQAEARRDKVQSGEVAAAQVAELVARIVKLDKAIATAAVALVDDIEKLGPAYQRLIADMGEARALTASAVRLAGGGPKVLQRLMGQGRPLDGFGDLAAAVGAALAGTGLGQVGPSLAPMVVVTPPSGAFIATPIGPALERLHAARLQAVESAKGFAQAHPITEETVNA